MKNTVQILIILLLNFNLIAQIDKTDISKSIEENTNLDRLDSINKILNYKGGDEVLVLTRFKINENGEVTDIKVKGPHPIYEEEAIRVIKKLPKVEPPKYNGKPVSPTFSLPIKFIVETERHKRKRLRKERRKAARESSN